MYILHTQYSSGSTHLTWMVDFNSHLPTLVIQDSAPAKLVLSPTGT